MKAQRTFSCRFATTATVALLVSVVAVFPSAPWQARAAADEAVKPLPNPYHPSFSGKALVHCHCVLGTSGCQSSFLWQAGGAQLQDWHQDGFFSTDKEVDLAEACYRKRDAEKQGDGLCCPVDIQNDKPDSVMLHRFFTASEVVPQP